jgi:hypothetical protein
LPDEPAVPAWFSTWCLNSEKSTSAYGFRTITATKSAPTATAPPLRSCRTVSRFSIRRAIAAIASTTTIPPAVYFTSTATPIAAPASAHSQVRACS